MKKINLFAMSLLALLMACFTACENNKYEVDHTAELVGTWTCIRANHAEALIFKADGTVLSTGVENGEYWENVAGTYVIENDVATVNFADGDNAKGHIDVVPGIAFTIYEEDGEEWTFNYCAEDLSEEVVGMWVVADGGPNMTIETFKEDGTAIFTGIVDENANLNVLVNYKVVGDLMFYIIKQEQITYTAYRLTYAPDATSYGDLMTWQLNDDFSFTRLRIKESLNFTGQTYDYSAAYVSNAKGKDEDFTITTGTFNMANINAGDFDVMFRSVLYCLEFPNATTIKQHFLSDGEERGFETPITIEGNKVTLDLSAGNPAYRKVEMYIFQSANDSQLHIYMPTQSFVNYFANLEIVTMLTEGKIDLSDVTAIEAVYTNMEARVESINLSLVFKVRN